MLTEELHWPLFSRGRTRDVDAASGICPPARWNPEIQEPTEFRLPAPPAAACSSASVPGKRRTSTVESSGSAPGAISIAEHTQNTPRELPDTQTGWSHLWWARVGPACPNFFLRRGGGRQCLARTSTASWAENLVKCVPPDGFFGIQISQNSMSAGDLSRTHAGGVYTTLPDPNPPTVGWGPVPIPLQHLALDAWSPVHTSNNVEATLSNATRGRFFRRSRKRCFDIVACCFNIVAGVDGALGVETRYQRHRACP